MNLKNARLVVNAKCVIAVFTLIVSGRGGGGGFDGHCWN